MKADVMAENIRYHRIIINGTGKSSILFCMDIMYCMADEGYCRLFLKDGTEYLISKTLQVTIRELASPYFIKVSQSLIVNAYYVLHIHYKERRLELLNKCSLPFTMKPRTLLQQINEVFGLNGEEYIS